MSVSVLQPDADSGIHAERKTRRKMHLINWFHFAWQYGGGEELRFTPLAVQQIFTPYPDRPAGCIIAQGWVQ